LGGGFAAARRGGAFMPESTGILAGSELQAVPPEKAEIRPTRDFHSSAGISGCGSIHVFTPTSQMPAGG
jgi:hypothetical protein